MPKSPQQLGHVIASLAPVGHGKTTMMLETTARLSNPLFVDWQDEQTDRTALQRLRRATSRKLKYPFEVVNGDTNLLEAVQSHPYVVLDSKGGLEPEQAEQLDIAKVVLIPTQTNAVAFGGALDTVYNLAANLQAYIVFTHVEDIDELSARQAELARVRVRYLDTYIPYSKAMAKLGEQGLLTVQQPANDALIPVTAAYDALAKEVLGLLA